MWCDFRGRKKTMEVDGDGINYRKEIAKRKRI